mgnify:FL=1
MSESAGSTIFSSAGIQDGTRAVSILRGVVMAPSGVTLALSGNFTHNSAAPPATCIASSSLGVAAEDSTPMRGDTTGSIKLTSQEFVMLLNGHVGSSTAPRVLTASLDYRSPNYFANVFNSDPYKTEEHGHCLYGRYDIHPALAVLTGAGILTAGATDDSMDVEYNDAVYLTTGSVSYTHLRAHET